MTGPHSSTVSPTHHALAAEDLVARLRLLRSRRVGVVTYRRLMEEHGSAAAALDALPALAAAAGVSDYAPCPEGVARAEIAAGRKAGAVLVAEGTPAYPHALTEITDAPPLFWAKGRLDLLQRPAVAMVGARNASSLGTRMARRLAADLGAAGYVVVSGLARGIDAAAHRGALQGGTIAVMAGGIDQPYPPENEGLAQEIAKDGLCLSEVPMGTQPQARHFPARNRIIAGLARVLVVVEAAAKSGSLITARNALDYGRDVLAVPGHPYDARAAGCNMLIRDGAALVRDAADVIAALGDPGASPEAAPQADLPLKPQSADQPDAAKLLHMILSRLGPSPVAEDQLLRDMRAPATRIAPLLVDLELAGKITRSAGGLLARKA